MPAMLQSLMLSGSDAWNVVCVRRVKRLCAFEQQLLIHDTGSVTLSKQHLPQLHVVLLQIMLLRGVLEENGIDPEVVLSSAGTALSEEASTEYDDDDEEDDEEEEEEAEFTMAAVASTAEGEAQSPGTAQDELSSCTSRVLCMRVIINQPCAQSTVSL